jgi:DNA-binding transcriptional MocR family regulator
VPLVEDLALAGLAWTRTPPPVAAHVPSESVAVIGSLSKLFWGGLRVGFVRAPEAVARRIARVKATQDLGSSAVGQLLAEKLLRSESIVGFGGQRRIELRARYALLARKLHEALPSWSWTEPAGGLSLWVRLPRPVARPFAQVALRHGVAVATAESLSPSGAHPDRVRLSFAAPADVVEEGVRRLARAWDDLSAHHNEHCSSA